MQETGVKYVIGTQKIDPEEFMDTPIVYFSRGEGKRPNTVRVTKNNTPIPPEPVAHKLYGYEIKSARGLGQNTKPDHQTFWRMMLGALLPNQCFEISKKDFDRAAKAVKKYTKESKKIFKESRVFVLEKNINADNQEMAGVGRVGRTR